MTMRLLDSLMAGAPTQFRRGMSPQGRPMGAAAQSLAMPRTGQQQRAAPPQTTMAADVDVNGLNPMSFGWQAGPDQVKQNRSALFAETLRSMDGTPGSQDPWRFNLSPQARSAWQEAGVMSPGSGNEGAPDSDQDIYSAMTKAFRRGMVDPETVGSAFGGGASSGLGGGSNAINAPDFSGMPVGDAFRNAVYGMNDPATGKFMGGFNQLSEVPMGSWGWGGLIGRMLGGNGGISRAGDPGGLPGNGHGAGNPGR
jgi:hypothetical protein